MNNSGKTDRAFRSERERLFGRISQLESDIALWENNIGFFAKSKKADGMIAEVRHKIQKAKENIKVLEEQVRLIDEQYED